MAPVKLKLRLRRLDLGDQVGAESGEPGRPGLERRSVHGDGHNELRESAGVGSPIERGIPHVRLHGNREAWGGQPECVAFWFIISGGTMAGGDFMDIVSADADFDDESGQVQARVEIATSPTYQLGNIAYHVTVLAEIQG